MIDLCIILKEIKYFDIVELIEICHTHTYTHQQSKDKIVTISVLVNGCYFQQQLCY